MNVLSNPATALAILQSLALFLIRSSLLFAAVAAFARLTVFPARRFAVWLAYLLGVAAYAVALTLGYLTVPEASRALTTHPLHAHALAQAHWTIPTSFAHHLPEVLSLVASAYGISLVVIFLLHLRRQSRLKQALLFAYDPSPDLATLFTDLAAELRVPDSRLLILPGLSSPATIGWLKPLLLLPPICDQLFNEDPQHRLQSTDILLHELHHIRRRDWLFDHIAHVIRAVFFFHPAVWVACSQLRQQREFACDRAVIGDHPELRARYAESLVRFARFSTLAEGAQRLSLGVDFAATAGHLHTRVSAILEPPADLSRLTADRLLRTTSGIALFPLLAITLPALTLTLVLPSPSIPAMALPLRSSATPPLITHHQAAGIIHEPLAAPSPAPSAAPAPNSSAPSILIPTASDSTLADRTPMKLEPAADTQDESPTDSNTTATSGDPAILASAHTAPSNDFAVGHIPGYSTGRSPSSGTSIIQRVPITRSRVSH